MCSMQARKEVSTTHVSRAEGADVLAHYQLGIVLVAMQLVNPAVWGVGCGVI